MGRPISITLISTILVGVTTALTSAQVKIDTGAYHRAAPAIGWDSLKSRMSYPEICKRAGIEGAYRAYLDVDSTGKVLSYKVDPVNYKHSNNNPDSAFVVRIEAALGSTSWIPARTYAKPIRSRLSIPVVYILRYDNSTNPLVIDADLIIVKPIE